MRPIEAAIVESVSAEFSSMSEARIPMEMARAGREQPLLLEFILGATEGMSSGVSELAGFIYVVISRIFRREASGEMTEVTSRAIQKKLEENEASLAEVDGTDPQTIDDALLAKLTRQPAIFSFMLESIAEAEEDETDPVRMSPEEKGALVLLLKTAIDTLDAACDPA